MQIEIYREFARQIRLKSLQMVHQANASHIGGAFSMADILSVLYSGILTIDPAFPKDKDRDRFILSKGHACSALYAALGLKGFFNADLLDSYAQNGSDFLSHTTHNVPGIEISAGSLGHGLPIALGMAIAAKKNRKEWRTYCLISDGELNEGSNWEAILLAPQLQLNNLTLIVDYNKIQSLGHVKDIIDLEPLKDKFVACRWMVYEVDGHNYEELYQVFANCKTNNENVPQVVIAHTVKGKGVHFMENKLLWHYRSPDKEQFDEAVQQLLRTGSGKI